MANSVIPLFMKIGLSEQRAKETAKNEVLSQTLKELILQVAVTDTNVVNFRRFGRAFLSNTLWRKYKCKTWTSSCCTRDFSFLCGPGSETSVRTFAPGSERVGELSLPGRTPDGATGALRYYQYFRVIVSNSAFIIINQQLTLMSICIAQLSAVSDVLVLFAACVSTKEHTT